MKMGKAFEILVKQILIYVGFSEVKSDGIYIFDGAPGQMIQGLGEAHNADVLLEPPVQTPFYAHTRLLIECKDYSKKVGLNTLRSVLGLREDINHFDIVDMNELTARRRQNRSRITYSYERCYYQVAIATINGYTVPAQNFAATHRIPLLEFNKMPFWNHFCFLLGDENVEQNGPIYDEISDDIKEATSIISLADVVGRRMAVAITNSGQMLFLYRTTGAQNEFEDSYSLHWHDPALPWKLKTGNQTYLFQLPDSIMKMWLDNATNELEMKKEAINCKIDYLSNMIVYYTEDDRPVIKMISIRRDKLESAMEDLQGRTS